MTAYSRGDVVLVGFVFSDESGRKLRPALVVSSLAYHRGRQERTMIDRKLGSMPVRDLQAIDRELRRSLGL